MRKKSRLSWFVLIVFMLTIFGGFGSSMPSAYAATNLSDIQGHWAQATIQKMVDAGVVAGNPDGTFKPDNNVSRAEFATMIVKAFNLQSQTGKVFSDTANHWAKDNIAIANANGVVSGYGDTFGPDDPITNEQMAVMIVKAAKLATATAELTFQDADKISSWAKTDVVTAFASKLIVGSNGYFNPQSTSSKAQAVVVINASLPEVPPTTVVDFSKLDKAGTYGPATGSQDVTGNVAISASGVILQNITISGDLLISEAVADGDVTLKNVTVKGTATFNGGGVNSITIDNCTFGVINVKKAGGQIRLVLSGTTTVAHLIANSGVTVVGPVIIKKVTVNSAGVSIETKPSLYVIASGISATFAGSSFSGTNISSGGGGGGGGGGGITAVSANSYAVCKTAGANWVKDNFVSTDYIYVGQAGINLGLLFANTDNTTTYSVTGATLTTDYTLVGSVIKATADLPATTPVVVTATKTGGGTATINMLLGLNTTNTLTTAEGCVYSSVTTIVTPVSVKTYSACKTAGATWVKDNFDGTDYIYVGQSGLALSTLFTNADSTTTYSVSGATVTTDYTLTGSTLQATAALASAKSVVVTANGTASINVVLGLNTTNTPTTAEALVYSVVSGNNLLSAKTFTECKTAGATWVKDNFDSTDYIYIGQAGQALNVLFNNTGTGTTYSVSGATVTTDYTLTGSSLQATAALASAKSVVITAAKPSGSTATINAILGLSTTNTPTTAEALVYTQM